ncbi:MAG: response regulator [Chloroflexota bacterium]|nr:response regulator [Chloroflexota bacterium]
MPRILVIDDDMTLSEIMRIVLEDAGHEVFLSSGPGDLPSGRYEAIVTDLVSLSVYDVGRTQEWVRSLTVRYPGTPVIVVTAHAKARDAQAAFGAAMVVLKPFDVDELLEAVRAVTS